ncbi:helix-turn-helix domain-containing protein [Nostoc sp.]|uniref:helix-turn-helix domain-containing protein n=1 Tax=Nostoc sp. TaxID=1180 RepID=UPI002FF8291C
MTQQAFKYRFYPTPEQETLLRRTMGCARLVYNRALAARTQTWYKRQELGFSLAFFSKDEADQGL